MKFVSSTTKGPDPVTEAAGLAAVEVEFTTASTDVSGPSDA